MDTTDDVTYSNYLREKNGSFLLQSRDVVLGVQDPTLNCDTIFQEFDGAHTWTIDGLPVLLNGSTITEHRNNETPVNLEQQRIILHQNEGDEVATIENNLPEQYPIELPSEGFITSNGLFLPNDVLLQFNLQGDVQEGDDVSQNINSETDEMAIFVNTNNEICGVNLKKKDFVQVNSKSATNIIAEDESINIGNLPKGDEVIQFMNSDGNIINIDKSLMSKEGSQISSPVGCKSSVDLSGSVETVIAYKCKTCFYLSESVAEISHHVLNHQCQLKAKNGGNAPKVNLSKVNNITKVNMKSILNVKQQKNAQKVVLLCSECNKGYSSTDELKLHMINEHKLVGPNLLENKEKEMSKAKRKQECLSIIKDQHKAARKVKCSIKGCESRFALDEYRIRHEHCHVNGHKKQFKCPACEKTFSLWRVCSVHLWKCHEIDAGLLSCATCSYKAFSSNRLLNHMLIHKEQRQFLCNECGKSFKQHSQLRNHQVQHMNREEGVPSWSSQQKCDICGNIFSDSKALKKHVQCVHNKFKPYVCNICGHKASRKAMLELHLRQHTGEKPYGCQICTYRTGDHNSLRRHVMRHAGSNKYKCPHCDYQSIQSIAYKTHIASKHPGKSGVFFCNFCPYHSVNKSILEDHEKRHKLDSTKETNVRRALVSKTTTASSTINQETEPEIPAKMGKVDEDDETQHGLLSTLPNDETVDTGGITIPAGLELQV